MSSANTKIIDGVVVLKEFDESSLPNPAVDSLYLYAEDSSGTTVIKYKTSDGTETTLGASSEATPESTPFVVYVETDGNNATAEIGNPTKPFATAQAALNAIIAGSAGNCVMQLGVGNFGGLTSWSTKLKSIIGKGSLVSFLGGIALSGASGADGDINSPNGSPGTDGTSIIIYSNLSVNLGDINLSGGTGGTGYTDNSETFGIGGAGGHSGAITLFNCIFEVLTVNGGTGGSGFSELQVGIGGNVSSINIHNCIFNEVYSSFGTGSTIGTLSGSFLFSSCRFTSISGPDLTGNEYSSAVSCTYTGSISPFNNVTGSSVVAI